MKSLRRSFNLLSKKQKRGVLRMLFYIFLGMIFEIFGLGLILPVINIVLDSNFDKKFPEIMRILNLLGDMSRGQIIFFVMGLLAFVYLVKTLFMVFLTWSQAKFASFLSADISQRLFTGYLDMNYSFHLQRNSSELLRNIQVEVLMFTGLTYSILHLITEITVLVGVVITMFLIEPIGALGVGLTVSLLGGLFYLASKLKLSQWGEIRQPISSATIKAVLQGLGGIKDVKILGREQYFNEQFRNNNLILASVLTKITTLQMIPRIFLELFAVLGLVLLIVIMQIQEKSIELLIPTLGVFVAASFRLIPSVNKIMAAVQNIIYSKPVINVLLNEFALISQAKESQVTGEIDIKFQSEIRLLNLDFSFDKLGDKILRNISLEIKIGSSVGIVGKSGSGKSTLIDIILGLLEPSKGQILVDNKGIKDHLVSWQRNIGYVSQSIYLIDDDIRNNIAFGIENEQIDNKSLLDAINYAQLEEFISSLPDGVYTKVGERGVRLSGGQRQRIGIARALYRNPEILVLDEATSSLDNATEAAIMESLNIFKGTKTLIIVAHRLSTVENCDRIYSLKEGAIEFEGTPREILDKK